MVQLSVIILSYNTKDITKDCLEKLTYSLNSASFQSEIIIVDNASEDGSQEMITKYTKKPFSKKIKTMTIFNQYNEGYPKGNNHGLHRATGKYVLFLNSDVMINKLDWDSLLQYLKINNKIGALTVRVVLSSKHIDPASHRGFPTIWNTFCYYTKLEMLTKKIPILNKFFGGYHLTHFNLNSIHKIDSPSGAFYLSPKSVLDEMKGFDEMFFMYGEDLDLSYRIKKQGYQIIYYPKETVTHLKYQSGLKSKSVQKKTKKNFYDAMQIFYRKHYEKCYPWFINSLVYLVIRLKSKL